MSDRAKRIYRQTPQTWSVSPHSGERFDRIRFRVGDPLAAGTSGASPVMAPAPYRGGTARRAGSVRSPGPRIEWYGVFRIALSLGSLIGLIAFLVWRWQ